MYVLRSWFRERDRIRRDRVCCPRGSCRRPRHHPAAVHSDRLRPGLAGFAFLFLGHRRDAVPPPPIDFVFAAHLPSTSPSAAAPAPAPPTRETPPAGKEASGQQAREQEICSVREQAAGPGGRAASGGGGTLLLWPSGKNGAELRAGGQRGRDRGGEREESPLIGCRRRLRHRLRSGVLVGCRVQTHSGRLGRAGHARPSAAAVLLPLPVLLQQIRPRLRRAAALRDCGSCCRLPAAADSRGRDPALGAAVLPLCREKSHGRHFGLWRGQREQLRRRWRKGAKSTHFSPRSHQCSVTCERPASTGFCLRSEGSEKAK